VAGCVNRCGPSVSTTPSSPRRGHHLPDRATHRLRSVRTGRAAGGLAQDLGELPLALARTATYLLDPDLDVAGYRQRLADWRRTLGGPITGMVKAGAVFDVIGAVPCVIVANMAKLVDPA
jgi:hypothetical protein